MRYFKIVYGYDAEDYVQIDETEAEKAYFIHMMKKDSIFSGGSVSGSKVIAVAPDYQRAMGWNRGYKLTADDYAELSKRGVDRSHMSFLAEVKQKVQHLIETNQTHLIGKDTKQIT